MYFGTLLTRGYNPNLCCSPTERRRRKRETCIIDMITRARISRIGRKLCNVTLDSSFSRRENFNLSEFWRPQAFYTTRPRNTTHPRGWCRANLKGPTGKGNPSVDVRGELSAARTALQGNQSGPRLIFLPLGATQWRNTPLDVSL